MEAEASSSSRLARLPMTGWIGTSGAVLSGGIMSVDKRVKERRGRPRNGQGKTKDGRKDMRGRPRTGEKLTKVGTKKKQLP